MGATIELLRRTPSASGVILPNDRTNAFWRISIRVSVTAAPDAQIISTIATKLADARGVVVVAATLVIAELT
jgi:hypothetical protein